MWQTDDLIPSVWRDGSPLLGNNHFGGSDEDTI